jgi:hypothetical protein
MLKKVVLVLGIVVVGLLAVIATRPDTFKVERSTVIAAPPPVAWNQVNDFHNWVAWSPWEKLDPNMKKTFDGPASGTGAIYSWVGNDKVGEGRMTILDSKPGERVVIKLEFLKPMEAASTTTFTFTSQGKTDKGEATQVHWAMEGSNNFVAKAMQLFMSMDSMVGKDFEKGLAQLKTAAETEEQKRATAEAASRLAAEAAAAAAPPAEPAPAAEAPAAGVTH